MTMPSASEISWAGESRADTGERKRESQATAIVRLATEAGVELWHTPSGDPYITVSVDDHREHYPLTSRAAKDYLCRLYFLDAGKAPNASALTDAINTLSGVARFDGDVHAVHVRVAGVAGRCYVDLPRPSSISNALAVKT